LTDKAHAPAVSAAKARRFGSWYFAEHVLRVQKNYGWELLAYSVGNPLMYLFAMGVGLATLVDTARGEAVFGGVSYLTFIAPALIASAAVMTVTAEFTYPIMDGFKWHRTFFGPHATPLQTHQIANGHIIAVCLRLLVQSVLYFAIVALFGASPSLWGWLTVPLAVLCGLSFGLPLMAYASTLEQDKGQFALVMRFIVTPLFLFSGTFFPLDTLPAGIRWIGWFSPLWHGTELGRVFSYGHAEPVWLATVHVLYLAALAAAGWTATKRIFARRLGK
jgi:lipooligosaccharide transport system permease protein